MASDETDHGDLAEDSCGDLAFLDDAEAALVTGDQLAKIRNTPLATPSTAADTRAA